MARLTSLYDYAKYTAPTRRGDQYFFSKNDGLQNQSVLYVQNGSTATRKCCSIPTRGRPTAPCARRPSVVQGRHAGGVRHLHRGVRLAGVQGAGPGHAQAPGRQRAVGEGIGRCLAWARLLLQPLSASRRRAPSGRRSTSTTRSTTTGSAPRSRRTNWSSRIGRTRSASTGSVRPRTSGLPCSTCPTAGPASRGMRCPCRICRSPVQIRAADPRPSRRQLRRARQRGRHVAGVSPTTSAPNGKLVRIDPTQPGPGQLDDDRRREAGTLGTVQVGAAASCSPPT